MSEAKDTGARLRALYQADGGPQAAFSTKVADYEASRPDYPEALFAMLAAEGALAAGATVADVGAGTGLLTRGLLQHGWTVVAVEPNAGMRRAADRRLGGMAGYRSVEGSAESMPLAESSVDLVTAAQAFHWFDIERSRAEFLRVLKPAGRVALIWNDRVPEDPVNEALDAMSARHGGARREALAAHAESDNVPRFFGAGSWRQFSWPHAHRLSEEGFLALVFSRSYIPGRDTPGGREVAARVREIFRRLAVCDAVEVRYRTVAVLGRPA